MHTIRNLHIAVTRKARAIVSTGLVATLMATTASVSAAQITFTGVTMYGFDGQPLTSTATLGGLVITQGGFSVTTDNYGYAGIGGTGNNLGLMSISNAPFLYGGHTFQMQVSFTTPTAANQNFFAIVSGSVSNLNGGAHLSFNPSSISGIPFSNGSGSGTFDFSVNNVSINAGESGVQLTGDITATTDPRFNIAPEPSSIALLAFGGLGIAAAARRRKQS